MTAPEILVRKCGGFEEFDACVRLQTEIWGYDGIDAIPQREFVVIDRIGGHIMGAFDLGRSSDSRGEASSMVGFAMAMPGFLNGQSFLHSHMLAVLPEYRNAGVGRRLKLAQREDALAKGIARMEWTFDPLEIKNAYLNIARLGAIVSSYTPNLYGVFSSRLQAGLPTDRLHAEWWLDSARVVATLNGRQAPWLKIEEEIAVPGAIGLWKRSSSSLARAEAAQSGIRARFLDAFERGLAVVGFKKSFAGGDGDETRSGDEPDGIYLLADTDT